MRIKPLYKYTRPEGGVTVSTEPPEDGDYTEMVRLIADKGFMLTDGETKCFCIDTDSPDDWIEEVYTGEEIEGEEETY